MRILLRIHTYLIIFIKSKIVVAMSINVSGTLHEHRYVAVHAPPTTPRATLLALLYTDHPHCTQPRALPPSKQQQKRSFRCKRRVRYVATVTKMEIFRKVFA